MNIWLPRGLMISWLILIDRLKVKLEVVLVGKEFHPGIGVSGWFGEGGRGELLFGADCFDLLGVVLFMTQNCKLIDSFQAFFNSTASV